MSQRKKRQPQPRSGFFTKLVILALLAAIGWQLYRIQDHLDAAETERDQYAALVAERERENAAMKADLEEGPTEEKLLEIARDELGLVKPGEYVFEPGG